MFYLFWQTVLSEASRFLNTTLILITPRNSSLHHIYGVDDVICVFLQSLYGLCSTHVHTAHDQLDVLLINSSLVDFLIVALFVDGRIAATVSALAQYQCFSHSLTVIWIVQYLFDSARAPQIFLYKFPSSRKPRLDRVENIIELAQDQLGARFILAPIFLQNVPVDDGRVGDDGHDQDHDSGGDGREFHPESRVFVGDFR